MQLTNDEIMLLADASLERFIRATQNDTPRSAQRAGRSFELTLAKCFEHFEDEQKHAQRLYEKVRQSIKEWNCGDPAREQVARSAWSGGIERPMERARQETERCNAAIAAMSYLKRLGVEYGEIRDQTCAQ